MFPISYLKIAEILENPYSQARYPKEEVLQCTVCNSVWHIDFMSLPEIGLPKFKEYIY